MSSENNSVSQSNSTGTNELLQSRKHSECSLLLSWADIGGRVQSPWPIQWQWFQNSKCLLWSHNLVPGSSTGGTLGGGWECCTPISSVKKLLMCLTCSITSGAIQHGVPTNVLRTLCLVISPPVFRKALTPKSNKNKTFPLQCQVRVAFSQMSHLILVLYLRQIPHYLKMDFFISCISLNPDNLATEQCQPRSKIVNRVT